MEFTRTEWHQVAYEYKYDVDEDLLIEHFGTVTRFKEILSHQELAIRSWLRHPVGDEPTEEEQETFDNLFWEGTFEAFDVEEDNWTDRKGGYDITYDLPETELLEGMS